MSINISVLPGVAWAYYLTILRSARGLILGDPAVQGHPHVELSLEPDFLGPKAVLLSFNETDL